MIHLKDIAPEFAFLLDIGFREADSSYRRESFGDAVLTLAGPEFALRFVRDRGQVFVDVALDAGNPPIDWCPLVTFFEFLESTRHGECADTSVALDKLSESLQANWPELRRALTSHESLAKLRRFMLDTSRLQAFRSFPDHRKPPK